MSGVAMPATAEELIEAYGVWGEHPEWPVEIWQYEVSNDETRSGYWQWVEGKLETE